MRVAIVGGTGDFGLALAARLVAAGDAVVVPSISGLFVMRRRLLPSRFIT